MGRSLGLWISIGSVAGFILFWQIIATLFIDPFFLPSPTVIVSGTWELVTDGTMLESILVSMMRILSGWILGCLVAIPFGLLVGVSPLMRSLIDPFIHFFRFVPAIALVTLFIVWFGVGEMSKILLIAYATAFTVMVNTASGVATIPQDKIDAARCLGADKRRVFFEIVIPATTPEIYVGMRLALASSFLVIVAAEIIAAESGLGYLIWNSRLYFKVDWMFGAIVMLGILGFLTDRAWRYVGRTALKRYLLDTIKY